MGMNEMEKKLAEYKCDTNEAICLKLVRFAEEVDNESTTFHPEYSHQLYGDDEVAFGYKGLQIQLYYSAGNLITLFKVKYSARVTENLDCVEHDDVEGKIREIIPAGFSCNTDDFISLLEKEANFKPFGTLLHTYHVHNVEEGEDFTYQIHKVDVSCPGIRDYHERLFIDVDDDPWDFFLVKKSLCQLSFATVGYMTVYNYYVYPDKTRPRVSQMLILPPFQGEGHGAQLLEAVHRFYCNLPKVQDLTDPSENYVKLRDYVLVKLCQTLPSFATNKLPLSFSDDMATEAREKLKINKKHARRVYEILRLRVTDMSVETKARDYRLEVKKRRFAPTTKNQLELTKMMRCLRPEELASHISQMDTALQQEVLEKSYQEVLAEYRRVIERLAQA
uniref:Histone acetyltransferase type B catalytic subunit n=1 Tax=Oncorhynchus tshawytscha TaxID=74940 RepID=A0AAZ3SGX6_ONCTS